MQKTEFGPSSRGRFEHTLKLFLLGLKKSGVLSFSFREKAAKVLYCRQACLSETSTWSSEIYQKRRRVCSWRLGGTFVVLIVSGSGRSGARPQNTPRPPEIRYGSLYIEQRAF